MNKNKLKETEVINICSSKQSLTGRLLYLPTTF